MRELSLNETELVDGGVQAVTPGDGGQIVMALAGIWASAVVGAGTGAVVGSIVPGAGNLAGAAAGALVGAGIAVGVILSD